MEIFNVFLKTEQYKRIGATPGQNRKPVSIIWKTVERVYEVSSVGEV